MLPASQFSKAKDLTDKNNTESKPLDWDTYLDIRKSFDEIRISQLNAFDKAILTISSSALAFSVVILTTFSGRGSIYRLDFLIFSWVCFSIAIVINLVSYLLAAKSVEKEIAELDDSMSSEEYAVLKRNKFVTFTNFANIIAILTFIGGVVFLLLFAFFNSQIGI